MCHSPCSQSAMLMDLTRIQFINSSAPTTLNGRAQKMTEAWSPGTSLSSLSMATGKLWPTILLKSVLWLGIPKSSPCSNEEALFEIETRMSLCETTSIFSARSHMTRVALKTKTNSPCNSLILQSKCGWENSSLFTETITRNFVSI